MRLRLLGGLSFRSPAQVIALTFAAVVVIGTSLLLLPWMHTAGDKHGFVTAFFTAVSAVSTTGLTVVDTGTYWTSLGQFTILLLVQIGGLGVMTMATLAGLLLGGQLGLSSRLAGAADTGIWRAADLRLLMRTVLVTVLSVEFIAAVVVAIRQIVRYGAEPLQAIWLGLYYSVNSFCGGGFAPAADSLAGFGGDGWMLLPLTLAVLIGGLGYPVLMELRTAISAWLTARRLRLPYRAKRWSLHLRIVLIMTVVLLFGGAISVAIGEWSNPQTLGGLPIGQRLWSAFTTSVMARSAGFTSIDPAQLHAPTMLIMDFIMFIGGGSASTAGGIKVTTFVVLCAVVLAEMRGERSVVIGKRRISATVQRRALTVTLLYSALAVVGTYLLTATSSVRADLALFEVISAVGTVGLSVGVSSSIGITGQLILAVLMFVGRVGPFVFAAALAQRVKERPYDLPEEGIIVG